MATPDWSRIAISTTQRRNPANSSPSVAACASNWVSRKTRNGSVSTPAHPLSVGEPLPSTEESLARGRQLYEDQGCGACHGDQGRGDGLSAPTLTDDWGDHIRAADLTQRWTWRGGATKRDIYRTFSTGLNGTPMPSYDEVLEPEGRWHLVNYVYSLGEGDDPGYDSLMIVPRVEEELDLERADELFARARTARFPVLETGSGGCTATTCAWLRLAATSTSRLVADSRSARARRPPRSTLELGV